MPLHLTLPNDLEERLRLAAERSGLGQEMVALRILDQHLPLALDERRAAAVALLQSWTEEDESLSSAELADNENVLRALDDDRPSHRKLFTDLLRDDAK